MEDDFKFIDLGRARPPHHHSPREHHHRPRPGHPKNRRFYAITCISNPVRYDSRTRLYHQFAKHMAESGVQLITVELAFGHRDFEVTDACNPLHVQVRSNPGHEVWHKECLLNAGFERLFQVDPDFYGAGWFDADIQFMKMHPFRDGVADWVHEICHKLEHHEVVQPWSHAVDLGPKQEVMGNAKSFCYQYKNHQKIPPGQRYGYWHSGYAWAARRSAIEQMFGSSLGGGPLLDFAPLGSADFYMAWALIGELEGHLYQDVASKHHRKKGFTANYINHLMSWQDRAQVLKRNIGYCDIAISHFFHGKKSDRGYNTRENILIDNHFDPMTDLRRNRDRVFELVVHHGNHRQMKLRDQMSGYMSSRNEDSIDLV